MKNDFAIFCNKEVIESFKKLPTALSEQLLIQFSIAEKNARKMQKIFQDVNIEEVKNTHPIKQLNFLFRGQNHRILGYNNNKLNKMALLSYNVVGIGEKVTLNEIQNLRKKSYEFTLEISKKEQELGKLQQKQFPTQTQQHKIK